MVNQLTIEQFARAMPKQLKRTVTPELVDGINKLLTEPGMRENFRDNLLSYTQVMQDGRFKIGNYVAAVKYVSHKLLGSSNIQAYAKTFPDRFQRLVDEGAEDKTISSYATAYNKTKLVQLIFAQTLTPTHVLNADLHQKAVNVQAQLMISAHSETVRQNAADSLLTHLKQPEVAKVEMDINVKQDKSIDELRATTLALVKQQRKMIGDGSLSVQGAAESKIVLSTDDLEESIVNDQ